MNRAGTASRAALVLIYLLAVGLAVFGFLRPVDRFILDARYDSRSQLVSGDRVFVAVDSESLAAIGVWPWPRSVHAQIIDAVIGAGAHDVAIDVDFSTQSTPENDAALVAALERAGGYAYLAAFNQAGRDGAVQATIPAEQFRLLADMFAVNVTVDDAGIARSMPYAIVADHMVIPSLAALAVRGSSPEHELTIDYGIRASTITTLSAIDVIEGRFDAETIAGKTVVVGASALELQDVLRSPNQGMLPGAVIQILAAETAALDRAIWDTGPIPALVLLALVLVGMSLIRRNSSLAATWLVAATTAVVAEIGALVAYNAGAVMIATAPLHLGVVAFGLFSLLNETQILQYVAEGLRGERDRMRLTLDRVVADNFDGIVVIAANWQIVSSSAFAEKWLDRRLVGEDARTVLPGPFADAVREAFEANSRDRGNENAIRDARLTRPVGESIAEFVVTVSRPERAGKSAADNAVACLTFRDVTDRRSHEARMQHLAEHDELTGAYARARFIHSLDLDLDDGRPVHVLVFNLRRFKSINATLGHQFGDEMLCQVVERLKAAGHDAVARLGADTFAMSLIHEGEAPGLFDAVADIITAPYDLGGHGATVGLAGGWASAPAPDGSTLLRRADLALAESRQMPGNGLARYSESLDAAVQDRRQLETEMRQALETGQFNLLYQPQVSADGRKLLSAEALLRWDHPERGIVSPLHFLPVAEETGLIAEIGRWVLDRACRQAQNWPGHIRVAINVSPLQFELGDVYGDVCDALARTGLAPARLELEITEGVLLQQKGAAIDTLLKLNALGVKIAIDDFGTGFSSLSYLSNLPFDVLKIDKSFVDAMFESTAAMRIVEMIIQLSKQLEKCVLAEGVETQRQVDVLAKMGCDLFQGYLFGRPSPAGTIPEIAARLAAGLHDRQFRAEVDKSQRMSA